jgi:alpha,alpha-trehalase
MNKNAYDAVLFDLDGVVTKTAKVHAAAWKRMFDEFLERRAASSGDSWKPFDIGADYRRYVDGKPRYEGVKSFLASRGIELPYGQPDDTPDKETICGLGNRKNQFFRNELRRKGVEPYEHAVDFIRRLRKYGFKTAVVSSSKNCAAVVETAHLTDLFDAKVDGLDSEKLELKGKPAPDIFLEAARRLEVDPARAIVVEDAISGVQAGRRGRFGYVIGVDRVGHAEALLENGADRVVRDFAKITLEGEEMQDKKSIGRIPSALESMDTLKSLAQGKRLVVALDYDGTLTPIVDRPELAVLSDRMRETVKRLANHCTVAVISGRDLQDVKSLVGIEDIFYAGSHGFDISGPEDRQMAFQQGARFLPVLDQAEKAFQEPLNRISGTFIERKKFSIAVHYRQVREDQVEAVEDIVDKVLSHYKELRKGNGKKVFEVQPRIDWDKGKALLWLLENLELKRTDVLPLYIGDDITDEDAFRTLKDWGIGIVVKDGASTDAERVTAARYTLDDPDAVEDFLVALNTFLEGGSR